MDRIDQLQGFIQVAEMGSFTRAAAALKWPRTTLSLAVQRLEDAVGARLLHRTTRIDAFIDWFTELMAPHLTGSG